MQRFRMPTRGHKSFNALHSELECDAYGNFVDPRASVVTSLNLSNACAIVLFEALRGSVAIPTSADCAPRIALERTSFQRSLPKRAI